MNIDTPQIETFTQSIWDFYTRHGRTFSWRNTNNPYHIVVSEIMLQQTQTQRVAEKYEPFIAQFPTWHTLATASIHAVLTAWQGLGYNRRALFLHAIAKLVIEQHRGALPDDPTVLVQFPGIGQATAASICAFAFNKPTVFIETNIRTVFIHFFFKDAPKVSDAQLLPLVACTVDAIHPRAWYYALMDYGVMLKKSGYNLNMRSKHYTKQSKFQGSDRQIRGAIVRLLTQKEMFSKEELIATLQADAVRVNAQLDALHKERFIEYTASGNILLRHN